jgi:hypothetical protein
MLAMRFTHWTLADGSNIGTRNWLGDVHESAPLHRLPVNGGDAVASFTTPPQPTACRLRLTDNGSVYTSRFTHGHNDFERLQARLGIAQKNDHPWDRGNDAALSYPSGPFDIASARSRAARAAGDCSR